MPSVYAEAARRIKSVPVIPHVGLPTLLPVSSIERVFDVDDPEEPLCVAVLGAAVNARAARDPALLAVEVSPVEDDVVVVVAGVVESVVPLVCTEVDVE